MKGNVTAQEFLTWAETHNYVWYQAPMDVHPSRVYIHGKIRRWKRDKGRFAVMVEKPGLLKFRLDNEHLDRIRIPEESDWKTKLFPGRFPGMSSKMAAIVGFVIEETYTDPAISELVVTSDGFVLAQHFDDCGANDFFGSASDLLRNWNTLLDAADLTVEQRDAAERAYRTRVVTF